MKPAPPVTRTLNGRASLRADGREKTQQGAVEEVGVLDEEAVSTGQHREPGPRYPPGQRLGEGRRREDVVLADQDQGRHPDPGDPRHTGAVPRRDALALTLDRLRLRLVRIGHGALKGRLDVLLVREEL